MTLLDSLVELLWMHHKRVLPCVAGALDEKGERE